MRFRPFFADDIFISYARRDSSTYATGLADELTKLHYSCFIDRLGTEANAELPDSLRRKLRSCALLVVVGTQWSGTRESIKDEIVEFKKTKCPIIPVDIGSSIYDAIWYKDINGIAPEPEKNPNALDDGNPSASVISRIEQTFKYKKRNERLRRWTIATAVLLLLLIALSGIAAVTAKNELANAKLATAEAERARGEAELSKQEAATAKGEADKAKGEAAIANDNAKQQQKRAEEAAKEADKQTQLAAEATTRAQAAAAEAAKQEGIAMGRKVEAGALARRTQSLKTYTNWADTLRYSTLLSLEAEKRLASFGVAPAESQESLRDSLNLLPREVVKLDVTQNLKSARLAPNGRYLITEEDDGFLRARATDNPHSISSLKVDGVKGFSEDLGFGYLIKKDSISVFQLPDFRTVREFEVSGAKSAKFSADEKYLVAQVSAPAEQPNGSPASSIFVWDIRDGQQLSAIKIKDELIDFALSHNNTLLSVSVARAVTTNHRAGRPDDKPQTTNYIQIWKMRDRTGVPFKEFHVPLKEAGDDRVNDPASMLCFSPDDKLVAASTSYHAVILNIISGGGLLRIGGPDRDPEGATGNNVEEIIYIGFSPDGKSLGTMGDDATMQTWDTSTGRLISSEMVNQVHGGGESEGPYFTLKDEDGGVRIIDVRTAAEVARIVKREEAKEFSYAPQAERIVFYQDQYAWIYHLGSAQQSASLSAHRGLIVDKSPDGHYVSFTDKHDIVVWDAINVREFARIQCDGEPDYQIRFSSHSKYMALVINDTIQLWETATGHEVWSIKVIPVKIGQGEDEDWNISGMHFSPGEKFFILETAQPATTRVWDMSTRREVVAAKDIDHFSSDERFVVLSDKTSAWVFDTSSGKKLRSFPKDEEMWQIKFSSNNKWMALGRGNTVEVSEIESGRPLYKKIAADEYPHYDFSPGGNYLVIASGDEPKQCQIYKAETGKVVSTLSLRKDFDSFGFSPDGNFIRTFTYNKEENLRGDVEIWEITTGRRVINCRGVRDSLEILFSPDRKRVAIIDANTLAIRVFNLLTGQQEAELLQDDWIGKQMFSDDGKFLAYTLGDRVRVWEVDNWREIARIKHQGRVELVNFINVNGQIATISSDPTGNKVTAQAWIASEQELIQRACEGVGRNLNLKEWQYNFGRAKPGLTCPSLPPPDTPRRVSR